MSKIHQILPEPSRRSRLGNEFGIVTGSSYQKSAADAIPKMRGAAAMVKSDLSCCRDG
jgi:hypothetical protein